MTSSQSETCVKLCSTYCCTALPTPDFLLEFWENRRHSSMKSGQGQHALCLSWKWCWNFHLVGLSAVSKQCKRDLREARSCRALIPSSARWESSAERHQQLFLQCTQAHSREAWYTQGCGTAAKWPCEGCCSHCSVPAQVHLWPEEKEPLPCRVQGWSHSTCLCRRWQSRASASEPGWNTDTNGWGTMEFFMIVLQFLSSWKIIFISSWRSLD